MAYTNSPLVTYKSLTKDKSTRKSKIDTITIHCYVGQVTAKKGCDYFATSDRQVSSNYVVGYDGSIGLSVEEKNRAWTTGGLDKNGKPIKVNGISGADNDYRAITIEVACDTKKPYAVTDEAYKSLIELVADICKRNGIKELKWEADKNLVGKVDKQNMTVHRWFANTECPGDFLYSKMGDIALKVNAKLTTKKEADKKPKTEKPSTTKKPATTEKSDSFLPARGYFKKGDKGASVKKINNFYYKVFPSYADDLGRNKEDVKGNLFGENTEAWTKEFQRRTKLTVDGCIGPVTLAELQKYGFEK